MSGYGRAELQVPEADLAEDEPRLPRPPSRPRSDAGDVFDTLATRRVQAVDLSGVTVLLVEDDPISREALELIFAYHGARVIGVVTAGEALEAYERGLPTVIVSDIGLPEQDGCALLRDIRTREFGRGRHTPAIAISAFPSRETGERARAAGFDTFLAKPIEVGVLLDAVEALAQA